MIKRENGNSSIITTHEAKNPCIFPLGILKVR